MSVARSASADGASFFCSSLARMNQSIFSFVQRFANAEFFIFGGESGATGWNAHHLRPVSISMPGFAGAGAALAPAGASSRGSGAPAAIHVSKAAIFSSGSLPVGGIRSSVCCR